MNTINLNEIKLVNWNANDIKSKKSTVIEFLSRHKIFIACITETHLKIPINLISMALMYTERTETQPTPQEE
jgi:hypothetical protein